MKRQKSCGPYLGKLVHQLPGVVTFAYDLRFRRVIACWKGIVEEIHFGGPIMPSAITENLDLEKTSFRPSKWPRKWKPAKNSKLPKWPKNCFEPFGKGGWSPISTWIIKPLATKHPWDWLSYGQHRIGSQGRLRVLNQFLHSKTRFEHQKFTISLTIMLPNSNDNCR